MTHDDKPKFLELLAALFGAHNRPINDGIVAGYWKGLEKMHLDSFDRCVSEAIEKLQYAERGVSKPPSVSELWDIKRNLRRLPEARPTEPQWKGDEWDTAANMLLVKHLADNVKKTDPLDYAPDTSGYPIREPGPHTKAIAKILAKWKDVWARDMREDRAEGGNRDGKPDWQYCMREADKEVANYLSTIKVAA